MKIKNRILKGAATALGLAAIIGQTEKAQAGWTGYLLGTGSGWAYVSVSPFVNGANPPPKTLKSPTTLSPGAWMAAITPAQDRNNTFTYTTNTFLPTGASTNTIARAKGFPGVVWKAFTSGSNGDKTDPSLELQQKVNITPASCPNLAMESALVSFDGVAGSIAVKTVATAGTALWIRGFEITPDMVVPEDDVNTPNNETTDFLKANAELRFENLMVGPFDYGVNDSCELVVHFRLKGGTIDNLAFVTDGAAVSEPIVLTCPEPQTVACGAPYAYPTPTSTGGCGALTFSYSPAVEDLVVGLNTVTVTGKDTSGDSRTCTFTVNVTDTTAPVAPVLADVTASCSAPVTLPIPYAIDSCAGSIAGTTTTTFPITTVGTNLVKWAFNDGHGNSSFSTQKVILNGLSFVGFYAPVGCSGGVYLPQGCSGGSCAVPASSHNKGILLPIKFDMKCGSTVLKTGPKPVVKIESWSSCAPTGQVLCVNATYVNSWQVIWDTSTVAKGVYKIIVTLPDGTEGFVFVNLK